MAKQSNIAGAPIAITGAAMKTSVGEDLHTSFRAFCEGRTGRQDYEVFEAKRYALEKAYEIRDRASGRDRAARSSQWLCEVVSAAMDEAGIPASERTEIPVMIGTGLRELRTLELWWTGDEAMALEGLHFGRALHERVALSGPVYTLANACSASNFALGMAADTIALRQAKAVVVAGCDSLTESMIGLAQRANPFGRDRVRPFDRDRTGVVLGEGAAAVVLETPAHAARRRASPLAWLRGVGMSCDAFHETAPDQEGVSRSMRDAHRRSGVAPADIDLLLAHGTGTPLNDQNEIASFNEVFGDAASSVLISGIKSLTGHTSGASALVGVCTAIACMQHSRVPPTVGLEHVLDEGVGLDFVVDAPRQAVIRMAQVNAFGFGGVNAVAVLEAAS